MKKKQKTKGASGAGQKRGAEEALSLPTLGHVAEEGRFAPLRELLQPVALTSVNELLSEAGNGLRNWLQEEASKIGQLPVALAFIAACGVQAEAVATRRAHVGSGEESPGKQRRERLLFLFVSLPALWRSCASSCSAVSLPCACYAWAASEQGGRRRVFLRF